MKRLPANLLFSTLMSVKATTPVGPLASVSTAAFHDSRESGT